MLTLAQAKRRILSKWNWETSEDNYPVILWGPPGVGKSHLIYELVAERYLYELSKLQETEEIKNKEKILLSGNINQEFLDLISPHCLIIRLAERPIEQLQGVIVPSLSEDYAKFVMPKNLAQAKTSSWGVVFLDELDKASDSKFGAATHLLENRTIGDFSLGSGWYLIAAANREEDSHLSNPIPPELRNRCANIEVGPDLDTWVNWALKHNIRNDIIGFHKFSNGEWLSRYDLENTYSFPTPRSWSMLSKVVDRLERLNQKEFDQIFEDELSDFVGDQAKSEFIVYRDLYCKFSPEDIIKGKYKFVGDPKDPKFISEQCVAVFSVADYLSPKILITEKASEYNGFKNKINKEYAINLINFIKSLNEELRTIFIQQIHNKRIMPLIMNSGLAEDVIVDLVKYLGE